MRILERDVSSEMPDAILARSGRVFARFDDSTQDSGNVSYGVEIAGQCVFVKTAGAPSSRGALCHAQRVFWLRNAVRLRSAVDDRALPRLLSVTESAHGPMLAYEWVPGELVGVPRARRSDPQSAYARFRALPLPELAAALTDTFRVHVALCGRGWVASDFYDGSLIYDFDRRRVRLIDLDLYREGPFENDVGRMFGSTRFMAPEELVRGSVIDETTTVFTMGRCLEEFLGTRSDRQPLQPLLAVGQRACRPERVRRHRSMAQLFDDWLDALGRVPEARA
jgi:hypothetical protein